MDHVTTKTSANKLKVARNRRGLDASDPVHGFQRGVQARSGMAWVLRSQAIFLAVRATLATVGVPSNVFWSRAVWDGHGLSENVHHAGADAARHHEVARRVILLVDDSDIIRGLYSEILERAGYEVVQACDGDEALDLAREMRDLDLVVTDFEMPEMNGMEVAQWFERHRPDVPVLMISASQKHLDSVEKAMPSLKCHFKTSYPTEFLAVIAGLL